MNLAEDTVEIKLRKKILGKTINGILENDTQCPILFCESEENSDLSYKK